MSGASVTDELAEDVDRYGHHQVALADALCDQHANSNGTALVCEAPSGTTRMSFRDLAEASQRLAGALAEAGVGAGDRVAVLLPKCPELLVTLLAVWRRGAVHVPLFTAFGPDAVHFRIAHSQARILITDAENRPKISPFGERDLPVICVRASAANRRAGDRDFADLVEHGESFKGVDRAADDPFILLYTSGTTGQPKGVEVPVRALAPFHSYMRHGLDLRSDDIPWNCADPGWAYGLYYGTVGTLLLGQTILWRAVPFDPADFYAALVRHAVTNLAGAPTVYRALRAAGVPAGFSTAHRLRAISSGGEPLNAELLEWSQRELGVPIHDHYGQSELGMAVFFAQHPELRIAPVAGSMGVPAPGMSVAILNNEGSEAPAGSPGEIAIDTQRSSAYWFRGYFQDRERTRERFRHGQRYYLTGDSAQMDASGLLFFASRADDVITSSGYRVGPFEVENALIAHPAVAEVAVIGTPDELRVEAVTAYVVLSPGVEAGNDLAADLQEFVKTRLARHLYPRRLVFVDRLPRTPSGKVRRTVLRKDWAERAARQDSEQVASSTSTVI
jgi:acetyl-CoA synthetase